MALTVEDGTGVVGAESYGTVAGLIAYWAARSHMALASVVSGATTATQEGALREASEYLDATYAKYYQGDRAGRNQGLEFPRVKTDDNGAPLPGLPGELVRATYELAARAIDLASQTPASSLAPDLSRGGMVKTAKAGPVSVTFADDAPARTVYGVVTDMLGPILDTSKLAGQAWNWR